MGAKQDAKATKPQNQLGGTPIRVLAMHPRIHTLRFLHPLEPAEAMTASYFRLEKQESRKEKPLVYTARDNRGNWCHRA